MANNTITVFEHSKLKIGEQGFKPHHFNALVKYNDLHKSKYFTVGFKKIIFKSYVGVIQAGDKVIEILPKADRETNENNIIKWQSALLYMLKRAGFIKINESEKTSQQSHRNNLLDIYIFTFLNEVNQLIHAGLIKKYNSIRKNETSLKGRLLVEKQIQFNNIHKERFFTEHTIYTRNNIFNAILKKALEIIKLTSTNYSIKQGVSKHLLYFEDIDSWNGKIEEFDKLIFDRKTKPYAYAIELSRMIILNFCPDMSAGNKPILAILFDMNKLFEKFIYKLLKKEEKKFSKYHLCVRQQNRQLFWKDKSIRPDILIDYKILINNELVSQRIIVDTKWKIITANNPSNDDLKQMYAYNLQFNSYRSVLFYPSTGQANSGVTNYNKSEKLPAFEHGCELYFSELFETNSIKINELSGNEFIKYLISESPVSL